MSWANLTEANLKYLRAHADPDIRISPALASVAEAIAKKFESKAGAGDGWSYPRLPWKKIRETAVNHPGLLREAHPSVAFGQLLRVGVQMIANERYKRHAPTYEKIARKVPSTGRQEFYAPLFGAARPQEVKAGTPFRENGIKGQDIEIINRKFGAIESFERELWDDDRTGQISQRAGDMGEAARMWRDQYFSRRFIGTASTDYRPTTIEASRWSGTNHNGDAITTPFSTVMYKVKGGADKGNRPTAYGQFNIPRITDAFEALRQAADPLGQPIVVVPNVLLHSTFDEIAVRMFLKSTNFPATPGLEGETAASASSGFMGGTFAANPFQGEFQPVCNVHLVRGVWALGEAQRGYYDQERDPMEVVQEQPQSGDSFNLDAIRLRTRERWEQDWEDPRGWFLGNDGTAALSR